MQEKMVLEDRVETHEEAVDRMLSLLRVSIDNEAEKHALRQISPVLVMLICEYCLDGSIDLNKLATISPKRSYNIKREEIPLLSTTFPIPEYKQTLNNQWFLPWRKGSSKNSILSPFDLLISELRSLKSLSYIHKFKIASALLKRLLEDKIWESGKNGKKAIKESIQLIDLISFLLNIKEGAFMASIILHASFLISKYQDHVNAQIKFFVIKRQGELNLEQFELFLSKARDISMDITKEPDARKAEMLEELNKIKPLLKGKYSRILWTNLNNIFSLQERINPEPETNLHEACTEGSLKTNDA